MHKLTAVTENAFMHACMHACICAAPQSAKEIIARRVALEFTDGSCVNLGIGIPTYAICFVPPGIDVTIHSENGLLGVGPYPVDGFEDADLINASKEPVTYLPGSSVVSSDDSFGIVRGGHLDMTVLGTLEVAANGDVANWVIPGRKINGMGGAMDLVAGCNGVGNINGMLEGACMHV